MKNSKNLEKSYYSYRQNALNCLPAENKHFALTNARLGCNPREIFISDVPWDASKSQIAVFTGFVSGGSDSTALHIWDFDVRGVAFEPFVKTAKFIATSATLNKIVDCLKTAPIERTQNGGLHLGYRIEFNFGVDTDLDGNVLTRENIVEYMKRDAAYRQKINVDDAAFHINARRWEIDPETLKSSNPTFKFFAVDDDIIEVDGTPTLYGKEATKKDDIWTLQTFERLVDGKCCIVAPSENYELLQGTWLNIPIIDNETHKVFLQAARRISYRAKNQTSAPLESVVKKQLPPSYYVVEKDDKTLPSKYATDRELGLIALLDNGYRVLQKISSTEWRIQRPKSAYSSNDIHGSYNSTTGKYYCYTSNDPNFIEGQTYNSLALFTYFSEGGLTPADFTRASATIYKRIKEESCDGLSDKNNHYAINDKTETQKDNQTSDVDDFSDVGIIEDDAAIEKEMQNYHVDEINVETKGGISALDEKLTRLLSNFSAFSDLFPTVVKNNVYTEFHMPRCILESDGMLGEWIRLALEKTDSPQPELAVASFMTALGALWGRRVVYRDRAGLCATNLYSIGVCASGQGKDASLGLIAEAGDITYTCPDGTRRKLSMFLNSGFESRVSLEERLEIKRRILWSSDEIGGVLAEKLNSNQKTTSTFGSLLNALYTKSNKKSIPMDDGVNRAERRAKTAKSMGISIEKLATIPYPSLSLYGVTNFHEFSQMLSGNAMVNGLLGRVDIITGRWIEKALEDDSADDDPIYSRDYTDDVKRFSFSREFQERWNEAWTVNPDADFISDIEVDPIQIYFTKEIRSKLRAFKNALITLTNSIKEDSPLRSKYARIYETTLRYAVILACAFHGRDVATRDCDDPRIADFAIAFALYQLCAVTSFVEDVYVANEEEDCIKAIRKYALSHSTFEHSVLSTYLCKKHFKAAVYTPAIQRMKEMREIEAVQVRKEGKRGYASIVYHTTDKLLKSEAA